MVTLEILIPVCGHGDGKGYHKREVVSSRGVHRHPASLQGTEVGPRTAISSSGEKKRGSDVPAGRKVSC